MYVSPLDIGTIEIADSRNIFKRTALTRFNHPDHPYTGCAASAYVWIGSEWIRPA